MLGYGLFLGLQHQNRQHLIQRFDNENYHQLETVTIKVPLTVPYATNAFDYERVDGEFKHQGEVYRMVKQRLYQDTLFIVCIKDHESKRLDQALTDYVKTFTDKPTESKSQGKTLPTFIKEYLASNCSIKHVTNGWAIQVRHATTPVACVSSYIPSIVHPPERS